MMMMSFLKNWILCRINKISLNDYENKKDKIFIKNSVHLSRKLLNEIEDTKTSL